MKPPNEEHTVSESTNHVYPKAAAGEQSANVAPNPSFPKLEESVLDYWDKDDTFQKSIERRPSGDHSQNEFVFFDGPPFAERPAALRPPADRLRQGRHPALPDHEGP